MRCPLDCGPLVPDGQALRDNRMGLPHSIHIGWCSVCGLGVTLDPPSEEELARLYEGHYLGEKGRVPRTDLLARAWHRVNGSLPLTDLVRAGPVLDVGSNTGEALVALRNRGLEVTGLEPNPQAAEVARGHGLEVISAPIEEAELPAGRFAAILLSQVLEHVRDPHAVLRKVGPALREGGLVYIVVPNAASVWRRVFGPHWVHWHVPFHLFHFTEEALSKLCAQCGLELVETRNVTPGEWLLMSLAAWPNARRGCFELELFEGRYGRRLLVAPAGRLGDALHHGDAIVAVAARAL
jgi:SAM-dependent methyltransferase